MRYLALALLLCVPPLAHSQAQQPYPNDTTSCNVSGGRAIPSPCANSGTGSPVYTNGATLENEYLGTPLGLNIINAENLPPAALPLCQPNPASGTCGDTIRYYGNLSITGGTNSLTLPFIIPASYQGAYAVIGGIGPLTAAACGGNDASVGCLLANQGANYEPNDLIVAGGGTAESSANITGFIDGTGALDVLSNTGTIYDNSVLTDGLSILQPVTMIISYLTTSAAPVSAPLTQYQTNAPVGPLVKASGSNISAIDTTGDFLCNSPCPGMGATLAGQLMQITSTPQVGAPIAGYNNPSGYLISSAPPPTSNSFTLLSLAGAPITTVANAPLNGLNFIVPNLLQYYGNQLTVNTGGVFSCTGSCPGLSIGAVGYAMTISGSANSGTPIAGLVTPGSYYISAASSGGFTLQTLSGHNSISTTGGSLGGLIFSVSLTPTTDVITAAPLTVFKVLTTDVVDGGLILNAAIAAGGAYIIAPSGASIGQAETSGSGSGASFTTGAANSFLLDYIGLPLATTITGATGSSATVTLGANALPSLTSAPEWLWIGHDDVPNAQANVNNGVSALYLPATRTPAWALSQSIQLTLGYGFFSTLVLPNETVFMFDCNGGVVSALGPMNSILFIPRQSGSSSWPGGRSQLNNCQLDSAGVAMKTVDLEAAHWHMRGDTLKNAVASDLYQFGINGFNAQNVAIEDLTIHNELSVTPSGSDYGVNCINGSSDGQMNTFFIDATKISSWWVGCAGQFLTDGHVFSNYIGHSYDDESTKFFGDSLAADNVAPGKAAYYINGSSASLAEWSANFNSNDIYAGQYGVQFAANSNSWVGCGIGTLTANWTTPWAYGPESGVVNANQHLVYNPPGFTSNYIEGSCIVPLDTIVIQAKNANENLSIGGSITIAPSNGCCSFTLPAPFNTAEGGNLALSSGNGQSNSTGGPVVFVAGTGGNKDDVLFTGSSSFSSGASSITISSMTGQITIGFILSGSGIQSGTTATSVTGICASSCVIGLSLVTNSNETGATISAITGQTPKGGAISIYGGPGGGVTTGGQGGPVLYRGGAGSGTSNGGTATLEGGPADGTAGQGGTAIVEGGPSAGSNVGGGVDIFGGPPGAGSLAYGNVMIQDDNGTGKTYIGTGNTTGDINVGNPANVLNLLAGTVTGTTIFPQANGGNGSATPGLIAGPGIAVSGSWPNQEVATSSSSGAQTLFQSSLPMVMPASGYIDAIGDFIIGANPANSATVSFSGTSGSVTVTFSAATLNGANSTADIGRVISVEQSGAAPISCTITADASSTTIATCSLSGTLSGSGPYANNVSWLTAPGYGTAGSTGAGVTFPAPMSKTYAALYLYFPASSPIGTAGSYFCQPISPAAGTCFTAPNSPAYSGGTPAIPTSTSAFSGLTAGAYTQSTGSSINLLYQTIASGALELNGCVKFDVGAFANSSANVKSLQGKLNNYGGAYAPTTGNGNSVNGILQSKICNAGNVAAQIWTMLDTSATGQAVNSAVAGTLGAINTASSQTAALGVNLAAATDEMEIVSYIGTTSPN